MKLTVLGCSGSVPGPDSPASGYLVESDGFQLILDLGHGAFGALQQHVHPTDIDAVLLSLDGLDVEPRGRVLVPPPLDRDGEPATGLRVAAQDLRQRLATALQGLATRSDLPVDWTCKCAHIFRPKF